jgi:hypothetical protein
MLTEGLELSEFIEEILRIIKPKGKGGKPAI